MNKQDIIDDIITHKNLTKMARVGFLNAKPKKKKGSSQYEVYVNTDDDGNIPHFHLRNAKDWSEFHSCIEFEDAKYFEHGNKNSELNTNLKKSLVEFFNKQAENFDYTNWELALRLWNTNNRRVNVDTDLEMPDYTKLLNNK